MPVLTRFASLLDQARRALLLVWGTSRGLFLGLVLATLVAGVLPALAAWLGQRIVDAVVTAMQLHAQEGSAPLWPVVRYVLFEAGVLALLSGTQRALSVQQSLLRVQLGQKVNTMILEKAQTLSLVQFENSEFYDKLVRVRREASTRPLALVMKSLGLIQNLIVLISFGVLLVHFSPWALVLLVVGALPVFFAEAHFSGDAFRLFTRRAPESRQQNYIETLLSHEGYIKEVKLFGFAPLLLQRYRDTFARLYAEDRRLTLRRDGWGFVLGLLGTAAFYLAYAWVVVDTVHGNITLGQMTMYLVLFKQGQAAVSSSLSAISGLYEDGLYLSSLYEYLAEPVIADSGSLTVGAVPGDGLRFENVGFRYPGASRAALQGIDLHLMPGHSVALVGENGSGKTTLIKLLTRLYRPDQGRILLDGSDLQSWDEEALRRRIGVIFQDYIRYQFSVGENIGVGDTLAFNDETRWQQAAAEGMAAPFIERLDRGYATQLGRWFAGGQELSGGQWQKIALSRAYMRRDADILILDEPTSALDPAAEAAVFEHFSQHTEGRMTLLISHRFSSVRNADHIIVLDQGSILERGDHDSLVEAGGRYAQLFNVQARGYRSASIPCVSGICANPRPVFLCLVIRTNVARGLAPVGLRSSPEPCHHGASGTPHSLAWRPLRSRTGASPLATRCGASWHLRQFLRPQIKHQHLGIHTVAQAQHLFFPNPHTIAFLQLHAVQLDTAARHMHIGVTIGGQFQGGAFLAVDQAGIYPRILPYFQRTVGAVRGDNQLQAPAFFLRAEVLLLVTRFGAANLWHDPDLQEVHRFVRRMVELAVSHAAASAHQLHITGTDHRTGA
ncbi:ABC-type multidrug transport system fused ATPase/permease subunit [Pseudomonas frederiksbergensis]